MLQFKNEHLRLQEKLDHMGEKWERPGCLTFTLILRLDAVDPEEGQPTWPTSPPNTFLFPHQLMPTPNFSISVAGISVTQAQISEMTVGSDTSLLCYPHSQLITSLTSSHKAIPILSFPPTLRLSELSFICSWHLSELSFICSWHHC